MWYVDRYWVALPVWGGLVRRLAHPGGLVRRLAHPGGLVWR